MSFDNGRRGCFRIGFQVWGGNQRVFLIDRQSFIYYPLCLALSRSSPVQSTARKYVRGHLNVAQKRAFLAEQMPSLDMSSRICPLRAKCCYLLVFARPRHIGNSQLSTHMQINNMVESILFTFSRHYG